MLAGTVYGQVTKVDSRAKITGTTVDTVDWGSLGPQFTALTNPFEVQSSSNNTLFVSMPNGSFYVDQQEAPSEWEGSFAPGDYLLFTDFAKGPITITFADPVYAVGMQFNENGGAHFTPTIKAYDDLGNLLNSVTTGPVSNGKDNSDKAPFLGIHDVLPAIKSVEIFCTQSLYGGFAINDLTIEEGPLPSAAGINPLAPLVERAGGILYGTCFAGGNYHDGAVVQYGGGPTANDEIIPLVEFSGTNGSGPENALTLSGPDQIIYGTTTFGGTLPGPTVGDGTVFMIVPNGASSILTTLWTFTGGIDGAEPSSPLISQNGNFYGATAAGGQNNDGVLYMLTPNGGDSTLTTLWSFTSGTDGAQPVSLTPTSTPGTFYGLAQGGGVGFGTIFELVADGTNSTVTPIATFDDTNGDTPVGALVAGTNGHYYGMTAGGGLYGDGTIFEVTTTGTLSTLVNFKGPDGAVPSGSLLLASDGDFYGTTNVGGTRGGGTIFRMTQTGKLTTLLNFVPTFGEVWEPNSGLIETSGFPSLILIGQASASGRYANGCIYEVTINGPHAGDSDLVDFQQLGDETPTARSIPAVHQTPHSAVIEGMVDPNGMATTAQFLYSTSNAVSNGLLSNATDTNLVSLGKGGSGKIIGAALTGLPEYTTYYYQVVASNTLFNGDIGSVLEFTTKGPPTITYNAPTTSLVTGMTTLSGTVNAEGTQTTAFIDYGPTDRYGQSKRFFLGDGIINQSISWTLDIGAGSIYHYRIEAQNAYGVVFGPDQSDLGQ